ncbi:hypothetical protein G6F62_014005 [Rhizopus arrhizus]|nr:hypothetical protein G6F62_014005 [Rhizopus arrhizus]
MRGKAAAVDRGAIGCDGHAVQFDGAVDGGLRQRHAAALPRIAQHEHVRQDAVAEQGQRGFVRVDGGRVGFARRVADLGQQRFGAHGGIGVAREVGDRGHVRVDGDLGVPAAQRAQRIRRHRGHRVAQDGGVGLLPVQAHGAGGGASGRQADMADDRTALLRQAGHVQHGDALAFDVGGRAQ